MLAFLVHSSASELLRASFSHLGQHPPGKGFDPKKIDFLPEPFAAFQYYRYGEKNAELQQKRKHRVLVLDFGGGTFDACGIETTKEGDISYSGQNQRPLEPIGGFLIDRFIAESLTEKSLPKGSIANWHKGLEWYSRWRKGEVDSPLQLPFWSRIDPAGTQP